MKRLAMGLTYYSPYVSGLTNTAKVVAEQLVERGWEVTVVASQHDPVLARNEVVAGVRVIRTPVRARINKGVLSPSLPVVAAREIRRNGIGNIHLPMPEAAGVAALLGPRPRLVSTYHCDVTLPPSAAARALERALDASASLALRRSDAITVTSLDYLSSSRIRSTIGSRAVAIPPPCLPRPSGSPTYRTGPGPHVGFLGRIVEEKGIPYLVRAFRRVAQPDWRLLIGGDFEQVAGGSVIDEVRRAAADDERIHLLGFLPEERVADFYASLDVFAFPSVNPLEAFGIAQVEAMFAGVPVVASDMPGVRLPVLHTGFGRLAKPRDTVGIGEALLELTMIDKSAWGVAREEALRRFSLPRVIDQWETCLTAVSRRNGRQDRPS